MDRVDDIWMIDELMMDDDSIMMMRRTTTMMRRRRRTTTTRIVMMMMMMMMSLLSFLSLLMVAVRHAAAMWDGRILPLVLRCFKLVRRFVLGFDPFQCTRKRWPLLCIHGGKNSNEVVNLDV